MDSEACFGLWTHDGHEGIDSQPSNEYSLRTCLPIVSVLERACYRGSLSGAAALV
jgi:hypothetical protein